MNIKAFIYVILCAISIGLSCILSSLLLLTNYTVLQYISLIITYLEGIYIVKVCHRYPIYNKKYNN